MTDNKTFLYLRTRYLKTHWPYYGMRQTKFDVGESYDEDIKQLRQEKMVQPVAGFNGWLIEVLDFETKWNKI